MKLWLQKPDIPFSREDANRYLPWVIAVMVCLVGLLLVVGISLHQSSKQSGRMNIQSFQVYLPYDARDDALIEQIASALSSADGVASVEYLSDKSLARMLSPWTGGTMELSSLPLPKVWEVTLNDNVKRRDAIDRISADLVQLSDAIEIESYQDWVLQLTQFTQMLRGGVFTLVALLSVALMALVAIIVRTSLKLNFQAVQLLHNVGATDEYILRQFVQNGCLMVAKGSIVGMGLASVLAVAVSVLTVELSSPLLPTLLLNGYHVLAMIALPIAIIAFTALLVRVTILHMLEQMH